VQEVLDQCDAGARASGDRELFFGQIGVGHDAADTVENLKQELGQDHDAIGLFALRGDRARYRIAHQFPIARVGKALVLHDGSMMQRKVLTHSRQP
jgi:hypothetical protein